MITSQKLNVAEPIKGFTEREVHSKALLNTDIDSLLKYKIQRKKFFDINKSKDEIAAVKTEMDKIKLDLSEIKQLLLQITKRVE